MFFGPAAKRHMKMNIVPQAGAQSAPVRPRGGLGGPPRKRNWADTLGVLGGTLMDIDGSMGRGHQAAAIQRMDDRQAMLEEQARQARMDQVLSKLNPDLVGLSPQDRAFMYGVSRDGVGDQRYADETQYSRGLDERNFGRRVLESDRSYDRGILESDRGFEFQQNEAQRQQGNVDRAFSHSSAIDRANLGLAQSRLMADQTAAAQNAENPYGAGEIKAMREKGEQLQGFRNSLQNYIRAIEDNGVQALDIGGRNRRAAQLDAMRQDLMFQGKNLWELGVLSKDDYDNMAKAIPDATGIGSWIGGKDVAITKADPLMSSIEYQLSRIPEQYRSYQQAEPKTQAEPNEKHIAYLRANPDQAKGFDLKFGAGAAARYLGQ